MAVKKWCVEKELNGSYKAYRGACSSNKTKLQTDNLIMINMENLQ